MPKTGSERGICHLPAKVNIFNNEFEERICSPACKPMFMNILEKGKLFTFTHLIKLNFKCYLDIQIIINIHRSSGIRFISQSGDSAVAAAHILPSLPSSAVTLPGTFFTICTYGLCKLTRSGNKGSDNSRTDFVLHILIMCPNHNARLSSP